MSSTSIMNIGENLDLATRKASFESVYLDLYSTKLMHAYMNAFLNAGHSFANCTVKTTVRYHKNSYIFIEYTDTRSIDIFNQGKIFTLYRDNNLTLAARQSKIKKILCNDLIDILIKFEDINHLKIEKIDYIKLVDMQFEIEPIHN